MKNKASKFIKSIPLLMIYLIALPALVCAANFSVPPEFSTRERLINAAGGFDYLPNGDILSVAGDASSGTETKVTVYLSEANGDFFPAGAVQLASTTLAPFTYLSFLTISPDGTFAIFGTSSDGIADALYRFDIATRTISFLVNVSGIYDLTFIDNLSGYVSYNPGFGSTNILAKFYLGTTPPTFIPFAEIYGVPSGPLTVDPFGFVHYVKSTYAFPPPPNSNVLMQFSKEQIDNAINSAIILTEADSAHLIPIDGGSDIIFSPDTTPDGQLLISNSTAGKLVQLSKATGYKPADFMTISDAPIQPSPTILNAFKDSRRFKAGASPLPKFGISLAKNGYTSFTVAEVELKPTVIKPLTLSSSRNTVQIVLNPVQDSGVKYSLSLYRQYLSRGKLKTTKIKTPDQTSNVFTVKKLKRGTYFYTYRTKRTVGGLTETSLNSPVIHFGL
jgi:hypothetical protein